jgi:cobalt-zinc-cadmium efflux system outer membrane protein
MRLHHILVPFLLSSSNVMAQESYTLESLERLAQDTNPALQAAQRDVAIARSEVSTARALPNPTVEFMTGPMRYKPVASGISGNATSYSLTQPLDLPFSRTPRIEAARAGLAASEAGFAGQVTNWLANLRMAYYDVLRRTAEQVVAEEDVGIVRSVQQKVAFSVKQGETAKFEAIRTEAELLNVQRRRRRRPCGCSRRGRNCACWSAPPCRKISRCRGVCRPCPNCPPLTSWSSRSR